MRALRRAALASVVVGVACTSSPARGPASPASASRPPSGSSFHLVDRGGPLLPAGAPFPEIACSLPRDWLVRTAHGYRPDRSGEIQILPLEPNVLGAGLPHSGPWEELQRVPLFWYGPGHIRPLGVVREPVTSADIAPTQAELMGFPLKDVDGRPLTEALVPTDEHDRLPRLVVTMVWDAAGMDVLNEWRDRWPRLRHTLEGGVWYDRATVGSSPSQTAQIHATIGTGAYSRSHGLVSHRMRIGSDVLAPWSESPGYMIRPTLADLYDRAMDNEPVVGAIATLSIQLGMLGHGSMWGGGDRDIVVIRQREDARTLGLEADSWSISRALAPYYRLPSYVNDVGGLQRDATTLDRADGALDGRWRDNAISPLLEGFDTPARIPYETRVVREVVRREGFGADEVPDMLFVNYKIVDFIAHRWSMNSSEMADAIEVHDRWLQSFFSFLDRAVGTGRWAFVLTADHGATPALDVTGGREISQSGVEELLQRRFDRDDDDVRAIEHVSNTQIYVDVEELGQNGSTLADVSRTVMRLTKEETSPGSVTVPPGELDDRVFRASYPSRLLEDLPCLRGAA